MKFMIDRLEGEFAVLEYEECKYVIMPTALLPLVEPGNTLSLEPATDPHDGFCYTLDHNDAVIYHHGRAYRLPLSCLPPVSNSATLQFTILSSHNQAAERIKKALRSIDQEAPSNQPS